MEPTLASTSTERQVFRMTALLSFILGLSKVALVHWKYDGIANVVELIMVLLAPALYGALRCHELFWTATRRTKLRALLGFRPSCSKCQCSSDIESGVGEETQTETAYSDSETPADFGHFGVEKYLDRFEWPSESLETPEGIGIVPNEGSQRSRARVDPAAYLSWANNRVDLDPAEEIPVSFERSESPSAPDEQYIEDPQSMTSYTIGTDHMLPISQDQPSASAEPTRSTPSLIRPLPLPPLLPYYSESSEDARFPELPDPSALLPLGGQPIPNRITRASETRLCSSRAGHGIVLDVSDSASPGPSTPRVVEPQAVSVKNDPSPPPSYSSISYSPHNEHRRNIIARRIFAQSLKCEEKMPEPIPRFHLPSRLMTARLGHTEDQ